MKSLAVWRLFGAFFPTTESWTGVCAYVSCHVRDSEFAIQLGTERFLVTLCRHCQETFAIFSVEAPFGFCSCEAPLSVSRACCSELFDVSVNV